MRACCTDGSARLRDTHVLSADELGSVVEAAEAQGTLTAAETQEIYEADVVVRGRRRDEGTAVYLVVAVSVGVGPYDVERAARRAHLLARPASPPCPSWPGRGSFQKARKPLVPIGSGN